MPNGELKPWNKPILELLRPGTAALRALRTREFLDADPHGLHGLNTDFYRRERTNRRVEKTDSVSSCGLQATVHPITRFPAPMSHGDNPDVIWSANIEQGEREMFQPELLDSGTG